MLDEPTPITTARLDATTEAARKMIKLLDRLRNKTGTPWFTESVERTKNGVLRVIVTTSMDRRKTFYYITKLKRWKEA